jgi:hypothetical protein
VTITEKIERLRSLKRDLIPEKKEDKERFFTLATRCTASYDKCGSGSNYDNSQEIKDTNYASCCAELASLENECTRLSMELIEEFERKFSDSRQRRIAKLYYVDGIRLKLIANNHLHYAYGYVRNSFLQVNQTLNIEKCDTQNLESHKTM